MVGYKALYKPNAFSRDDSLHTDVTQTDNALVVEEQAPFCDCPPDPEIPPELNLKQERKIRRRTKWLWEFCSSF